MSDNYNKPLSYIRPTPEKDFPAELVVRRPSDDDLVVVLVTKKSLVNLISDAMKLMREFEAREEREKENDEQQTR
jgi:hypothetical protein